MRFNGKEYKIIGYSRINLDEEFKAYKSIVDEILENSKFYTPEYGMHYENIYADLEEFIEKYASKYVSFYYTDKIFLFSNLLKGTYIAQEIK